MNAFSTEFFYRSKFKLQKTMTIKNLFTYLREKPKLTRIYTKIEICRKKNRKINPQVAFECDTRGLLTVEDCR